VIVGTAGPFELGESKIPELVKGDGEPMTTRTTYNDRILSATAGDGTSADTGTKGNLKVGDIRRVEHVCPNCGKAGYNTDDHDLTAFHTAHILRVPATCDHCTCVFTLVYSVKYIHSRVDLEASPPEEPECENTDSEAIIILENEVTTGDCEEPKGDFQVDLSVRETGDEK
jgi:hypothetical protein